MNPVQGQQPNQMAQQMQQFGAGHHAVYEKLRTLLMNLHAQGVPGMDNILNALNKEHVNQVKQGQQPQMPQQQSQQPAAMGQSAIQGAQVPRTPYNPQSLEALAEQKAGVPAGFFRWYDNTMGKTHTAILPQELQGEINKYVTSGAKNVWGAAAGAAQALPQLPQATLDAFPMIAPMMSMPSYGDRVQQGMGQQKG